MDVLVVEQQPDAPAGHVASWAAERRLTLEQVRVHAGDPWPRPEKAGRIVVLGSDQDLDFLSLATTQPGNQSLDLNSPAGGFRSVRIYDSQGRIIEEKQILDNPETIIPAEIRAKLLEESGAWMTRRLSA